MLNRADMTQTDADIYDHNHPDVPRCPLCGAESRVIDGVCHSLRCAPDDGSALFVAGAEEASRLAINNMEVR